MQILVIDNDTISNAQLSEEIFKENDQVISVYTEKSALEKSKHHSPDLIILNLYNIGKNGIGIINKIRQNLKTRETPILALVRKDNQELQAAAKRAGADDILNCTSVCPNLNRQIQEKISAMQIA